MLEFCKVCHDPSTPFFDERPEPPLVGSARDLIHPKTVFFNYKDRSCKLCKISPSRGTILRSGVCPSASR